MIGNFRLEMKSRIRENCGGGEAGRQISAKLVLVFIIILGGENCARIYTVHLREIL